MLLRREHLSLYVLGFLLSLKREEEHVRSELLIPENPLFVFSFLEEEHVRFGFCRELKRRDRDRDGECSIQLVHCFVF